MKVPFETITKIPEDREVDAVPELWNRQYREMDQNFAAIQQALTSIEANLQAIKPAGVPGNLSTYLAEIKSRLNNIGSAVGSGVVSSINGKTGAVTLTARDFPDAMPKTGGTFTSPPYIQGESNDSTEDNRLASRRFVRRLLDRVLGEKAFQMDSSRNYVTILRIPCVGLGYPIMFFFGTAPVFPGLGRDIDLRGGGSRIQCISAATSSQGYTQSISSTGVRFLNRTIGGSTVHVTFFGVVY